MTRDIHRFWLHVTAVVVGAFGPVFALATIEGGAGPARWTLDLLSWPIDGDIAYATRDVRFLSALTGGFLLGWAMTIWVLARRVYDLGPEPVRKAVLVGLIAWFCLDSAGSVASGAVSNVGFNLVVLLVAVGPLWRPAIEDRQA